MDNNYAERMLRPAVIVRQLARGSKSAQAAQLMSCMTSVFQTLWLNDLNVYQWLVEYLSACASNGGQAPSDVSPWLPWSMDDERLGRLRDFDEAQPQGP